VESLNVIALLGGECAPSFRSGSTDDRSREKSDERVGGGRAEKPPRARRGKEGNTMAGGDDAGF
jgi:hypothetical protein